jgi:hypothetical protein
MRLSIGYMNIKNALLQIENHTIKTLQKHGDGSFSSSHEISGVLLEEFKELTDALHANDIQQYKKELLDIAQVCQFAIACIDQNTIGW